MVSPDTLAGKLPLYMPSWEGSGNYTYYSVLADSLTEVETTIADMADAAHIQRADTIPQLEAHGALFDVYPTDGETVDHYRARILVASKMNTNHATVNEVISLVGEILQVSTDRLFFDPVSTDNARAVIYIEATDLSNKNFTASELGDIIRGASSASCTIDIITEGSMEYITPAEHTAGAPYPNAGYASLDVNGDPTGGDGYSSAN